MGVLMATRWRRLLIFILALMPFGWIFYQAFTQQLGADPAKTIVLFTGQWTFYCLLISLSVTPLKRLLGWGWVMPHRRMLGLFALFYGLLHLLAYLVFILGWNFALLADEIIKRPYITVGAPALLILMALGVTSTKGMMRRLGKRWVMLHRLVYVAAILAWVHVLLQVRASYFDAVLFGTLTLLLLAPRLWWFWRRRYR
ncbi:MAG TPA: protein-methionine-sulfoxide reductase heme-binding subunit MsrQ [Cellvibrionaceae bacterium]